MARMTVSVDEETREKLIELAGGERKIGVKLDQLVSEEYQRETVNLAALAERVEQLEESLKALPDLQWFEEKLDELQPRIDEFTASLEALPDLQWLEEKLDELQPRIDELSELSE